MKLIHALFIACVLVLAGCGSTGTLHKPTTAGNIGTTALVAYTLEGVGVARQVLRQPACATPAVYPCVPQSVKDKVDAADLAAYTAAKAADAAGATQVQKDNAIEKLAELKRVGNAALSPNN